VLATVLVAGRAYGEDVLAYRVKTGDSLELIASELYGDRAYAPFIVAENKLTRGKPVRPGERLRLPVPREVITAPGDTFESLADTYLGDDHRAALLAQANGMSIEDGLPIPTGSTVIIPMRVTHTATGSESLASIAQAYLADPKQAEVLRQFNGVDKSSLDKGDSLIVPALTLRVRRMPPLDAKDQARRAEHERLVRSAAESLPRARSAWLQGEFAAVIDALSEPAKHADYLDRVTAADVELLLGKAELALGQDAAAQDAFKAALARRPRLSLSPYRESPKVITVWKQLRGEVDGQ
jgi:LysM repeat protein